MSLLRSLLLATLILSLSSVARAEEPKGDKECSTCVERKKPMCADECLEVPREHVRECQLRCVREYCDHRCDKDAPQLADFRSQSCESCLDEQFVLCEKQCSAGTPRGVAECKMKCSAVNCFNSCNK